MFNISLINKHPTDKTLMLQNIIECIAVAMFILLYMMSLWKPEHWSSVNENAIFIIQVFNLFFLSFFLFLVGLYLFIRAIKREFKFIDEYGARMLRGSTSVFVFIFVTIGVMIALDALSASDGQEFYKRVTDAILLMTCSLGVAFPMFKGIVVAKNPSISSLILFFLPLAVVLFQYVIEAKWLIPIGYLAVFFLDKNYLNG